MRAQRWHATHPSRGKPRLLCLASDQATRHPHPLRPCSYKWDTLPSELRPERGLLGLRAGLNAFANLRPTIVPAQVSAAAPSEGGQDGGMGAGDISVAPQAGQGLQHCRPLPLLRRCSATAPAAMRPTRFISMQLRCLARLPCNSIAVH